MLSVQYDDDDDDDDGIQNTLVGNDIHRLLKSKIIKLQKNGWLVK